MSEFRHVGTWCLDAELADRHCTTFKLGFGGTPVCGVVAVSSCAHELSADEKV